MKTASKSVTRRIKQGRNRRILSFVMYAVTYAIILFVLLQVITPRRYDVLAGDVATENITATKDIEDSLTTRQKREAATAAVEEIYKRDEAVTNRVLANITEALEALRDVHDQGEDSRQNWIAENPGVPEDQFLYSRALVLGMQALLPIECSEEEVQGIFTLDVVEIAGLKEAFLPQVSLLMADGFRQSELSARRNALLTDLSAAEASYPGLLVQLTYRIVDKYLEPNVLLDEEATSAAREAAAQGVEPVMYKKGQNVVPQGEIITAAQIEVLKDLGLLNDNVIDLGLYAGIAALLALLLALPALYAAVFLPDLISQPRKVLLFCIVVLLDVLLSAVLRDIQPMLMTVCFSTMLIAILLHTRLALVSNIALAVISAMQMQDGAGLFGTSAVAVMLTTVISGTLAVYMCRRSLHRTFILFTGFVVGAAGTLSAVAVGMVTSDGFMRILAESVWVLLGGVASAIIVIGTLPIWELLFDIITPTKLLELTNSNQPLLRRLALEAPGTHHHSIVVANLAETVAAEVNADPLLVRAAAYYHDIGKLTAPECYTENQQGANFHDLLTPEESVAIIRSHPAEGAEMARKAKLPKPIIDIIEQHQGSMPIYVFYHKALEQNQEVNIADYSYPGPRPTSKEAAVIMLADSIEAAVRSLPEKNPEIVRQKIDEMIMDRINHRQFHNCDITLKELDILAREFTHALSAVHHERIAYPKLETIEKEEASRKKAAKSAQKQEED